MKHTLLIISLIIAFNLKGQEVQSPFFGKDTVDIKYFDKNDEVPKTMKISGEIIGVSTGTSCGVFQSSGTLKIKLTKRDKGYQDPFIYIVIPCLTMGDELISKKVSLKVTALYQNNEECYKPILNKFNSNGTPFYWLNQAERKKFYQQVK